MILLLASHNATKRAGLARALAKAGVHTVGADELGLAEPEETGSRFIDNATLKAVAAAQASGMVALADDSGFVMPVLDGGPGVYTADWSYTATGRDWNQAMDRIHDEVLARGAHFPALAAFVATLVIARPDGRTHVFTREQGGHAVWPPRPGVGFALDPIFVPFGAHQALSEMDAYDAAAYDHRARAAADVAAWLATDEGRAFADLGQTVPTPHRGCSMTTSAHERLHIEAIRSWLAEQGWQPRQVSLYDEEGVEGWTWENPNSPTDFTTTGDWNDVPEIPDDLMLMATEGLLA